MKSGVIRHNFCLNTFAFTGFDVLNDNTGYLNIPQRFPAGKYNINHFMIKYHQRPGLLHPDPLVSRHT
jgi:hypothetical protein